MKAKIIGAVLVVLLMGLLLPGCSSAQITELKVQTTELEGEITELTGEIEAKDARIAKLNNEIKLKNKRIVELLEEIEGSVEPAPKIAKIEITFNPNLVPCRDGYWLWRVILTEVNGVGVKLNNLIYTRYGYGDALVDRRSYDSPWLEGWIPSAYLSPYGQAGTVFHFPCQNIGHAVITVIGIDDNGNKIMAEGWVQFQKR